MAYTSDRGSRSSSTKEEKTTSATRPSDASGYSKTSLGSTTPAKSKTTTTSSGGRSPSYTRQEYLNNHEVTTAKQTTNSDGSVSYNVTGSVGKNKTAAPVAGKTYGSYTDENKRNEFINLFNQYYDSSDSLFKSYDDRSNRLAAGEFLDDAQSFYNDIYMNRGSVKGALEDIADWLYNNSESFNRDDYNYYKDAIRSERTQLDSIYDSFGQQAKYFSSFADGNQYAAAYAQQNGSIKKFNTDAQKAVDEAKKNADAARKELDQAKKDGRLWSTIRPDSFAVDYQKRIAELEQKVADAEAVEADATARASYGKQYATIEANDIWYQNAVENGTSAADIYVNTAGTIDTLSRQRQEAQAQLSELQSERASQSTRVGAWWETADTTAIDNEISATKQRIAEINKLISTQQSRLNYADLQLQSNATGVAEGKQRTMMADAAFANQNNVWTDEQRAGLASLGDSIAAEEFRNVQDWQHEARSTDYMRPTDQWTQGEKDAFYALMNTNEEAAKNYAIQRNRSYAEASRNEQTASAREWGAGEDASVLGKIGRGAVALAANVAATPVHLVSWVDKMAETLQQGGNYVGRDNAWISDRASARVEGRAEQLNEDYGTIAGKGFGDLYQLGSSIAQSLALGNIVGEAGTLIAFFGQAADQSYDEAISRGATGEQAALYSMLSGVAEVAGEKLSLDNLLDTDKRVLNSVWKSILTQAGIEGSEEAMTDVFNLFNDYLALRLSGGQTEIQTKIDELMAQGMSYDEASKQAWKEVASDVAWDVIGGAISGGVSSGIQFGVSNFVPYESDELTAGNITAEAREQVNRAADKGDISKLANVTKRAENRLDKGKSISVATARSLVKQTNRASMVDATEQQVKNRTELDQKEARSLANAVVAKVRGEQLTSRQLKLIDANKDIANTLTSELKDADKDWAMNIGVRGEDAKKYGTKKQAEWYRALNKVSDAMTVDVDGAKGTIMETVRGNDGKITGYKVQTASGISEVSADAANLNEAQQAVAHAMTESPYAAEMINSMKDGQNAAQYTKDFQMFAELYGFSNSESFDEAWKQFSSTERTLTEEQARAAWNAGKNSLGSLKSGLTRRGTGKTSFDSVQDGDTTYEAPTQEEQEEFMRSSRYSYLHAVARLAGVDIVFFKAGPTGINGKYENGTVYLAIDASPTASEMVQGYVMSTAAHELTHYIRQASPENYVKLKDFVVRHLIDKGKMRDGMTLEDLIQDKQENYLRHGVELSVGDALEEVVADACEMALRDNTLLFEMQKEEPGLHSLVKKWLKNFLNRIKNAFVGNRDASHIESENMEDVFNELQQLWTEGIVASSKAEVVDEYTELKNGNTTVGVADENTAVLSLKTWDDGGKAVLEQFLQEQVLNGAITTDERNDMLNQMSEMYKACKDFTDQYATFGQWSSAEIVRDPYTGNPVFSVVKANGDYALNLDFSLVCKKRRTLDAVFNEMAEMGIMDDFNLKENSIAAINDIIRDHGFETACALCFVDSKRYRQAIVADSFCKLYNPLVRSMLKKGQTVDSFNFAGDSTIINTGTGIDTLPDSELDFTQIDKVLATEKPGTVKYKIAKDLKENPADRKLVHRGDFMSTAGFDAINQQNKRVLGLYNSKKGAGGPKAAQSDVQYLNEIIQNGKFNAEAAYAVGGVRIQSFSDYVPRMVFDYLQMIADLSAKKLPSHAYTKEALFALQFGLTGIKTNMSLVPEVIADGVAPGLDKDGNYAWRDGQSFGSTVYDDSPAFIKKCLEIIGKEYTGQGRLTAQEGYELALAIQRATGYSENCGTIAVGISEKHIRKLLRDPDIRMVIPYHKSSLNHIVAVMTNIDKYHDYTKVQSTRNMFGNKLSKEPFNYNEALQRLGDAKAAADEYLRFCADNGYIPKFDEFKDEENYYKLLEDFSCYDEDGTATPQHEVSLTIPTDTDAFGSMKDLIQLGLEEDALLQAKQDAEVPAIIEDIQKTLPGMETQWKAAADEKARKSAERKAKKQQGKYAIKNDNGLYDPRTVTEQDVLDLIYNATYGLYDKATLIPVRINTPGVLIRSAYQDSDGKVTISNLPMVMYVEHVQQITEESEGRDYGDNKRPHEIIPEDLVEIIKKMNTPADVVIQNNKKYAEIIHHKTTNGKNIIAVVSVGENADGYDINPKYLNGFSGGSYNLVVTIYPADSMEQYQKKYEPRSILEKNGDSQRSSDSTVSSLLNESPFFITTVPQGKKSVKTRDNAYESYNRRAVVSEDTLEQWLKDYAASNPNYAQAYIAYMTPKQFLNLTTEGVVDRIHIAEQAAEMTVEEAEARDRSEPIFLRVDAEGGLVTGHEGRHRMSALYASGVEKVPILLFDSSNKYSKTSLEELPLRGQFNDYHLETVSDVEPLSRGNIDTVREKFSTLTSRETMGEKYGGKHTVKFSIKQDNALSDRELLANTLMSATQNDGEKRRLQNYKDQLEVFYKLEEDLQDAERKLTEAYHEGDEKRIAKAKKWRDELSAKLNKADSKLLEIQATKPLKDLMARVKRDTKTTTRQQIHERQSKTELRNKIKRLHESMSKELLKPTQNRYVPKDLIKSVADILELVNTDSGRSERLTEKINTLNTQYRELSKENDMVYDANVAEMVQKLAEEITGKTIYDLNKTQLKNLYDTMKAIQHTVTTAVKMVGYETEKDAFQIAKGLMQETASTNPLQNKYFNKWLNASMRPESFFKRIGGYHDGDWMMMYDMLDKAQLYQSQLQMEGSAIFQDLMNDTDNFNRMTDAKNLIDIGLKDINGEAVPVTMDIAIKIYMDTLAEDNARHLMYSGYTVPDMRTYYKNRYESFDDSVRVFGYGTQMSDLEHQLRQAEDDLEKANIEAQIEALDAEAANWVATIRDNIWNQMGDYEKSWVEAARKFFNGFSQEVLNKTTLEVYGFEKATVENYVPIHTDSAYLKANFESISKDMSIENMGFMKDRMPNAKTVMLAEGIVDIVSGQIDKVAKYAAMMPAVRNFTKVYSKGSYGFQNSVQAELRSKFKSSGVDYIEHLIADLTGSRNAEKGGMLGDFANTLRGNLAASALTLNPRVALGQTASYPTAAAVVGWSALGKALKDVKENPMLKNNRETLEEIAKYSPLMWLRMQGYFDESVKDMRSSKTVQNKVSKKLNFLTNWIETMDGLTVGQLWFAAQYWVEDKTDLKRGTEEFMQKSAEMFNKIVEETQPDYTALQRPDILRNPNAVVKQMTMFMTQRLQNVNILFDAVGTYNQTLKDNRVGKATDDQLATAKKSLTLAVSSQLAAAATITAFKLFADALMYSMKGYRDDDDELTKESIMNTVLVNSMESLASNFLWGAEIYDLATSLINKETYYGVSLAGVDTFVDMTTAFVNAANDPTKTKLWKLVKNTCQLLGIPLTNMEKMYNAVRYRIDDVRNGEGWNSYASEVKWTDEQRGRKLYDALVRGDKDAAQKQYDYFGNKADANEQVVKYIKKLYADGELSEEDAALALQNYADVSVYDSQLTISKLKCEKDTGIKYDDIKEQYMDGNLSKEKAAEYRSTYGDIDLEDAEATVQQWTCEKETGYAYDSIRSYIESGDITEQEAVDLRVKYGGQEEDAAVKTVRKWMCEIETGIPYDKIEDYYAEGLLDKKTLTKYYMDYGLYDEEKANSVANKREFIGTDTSLEDASLAAVEGYWGYCEDLDVDKKLYLDTYQYCYTVRADKNAKGKSISGTAAKKKCIYINSLSLTTAQKTAVAKAVGISDKSIKKYAPWA